ncbi:MAG: glycosyltransferase family 39 protein [Deltaproteobacteria bacterium]|nr:glycosyltransferase family 39 protein [Deltaproteobacteria bacterium]
MGSADAYKKAALTVAIAVYVFVAALLIDPIAGGIPQLEFLTAASRFFSFIGNGIFLLGVSIALFLAGYLFKQITLKETGAYCVFSAVVSGVAAQVFKTAVERPRAAHAAGAILKLLDNPALFDFTGKFNSFPSGHATVSFALAYVLSKRHPAFAPFFYIAAMLVGLSRIYLGSHYPSDAAAGAILGMITGWIVLSGVKLKPRLLTAIFVGLVVFISFFKSGGFFLFDVDEAVFSEASREMLETGDFITPTYNLEPRYDKPVLIYWFMAASYKLLGISEFSARAVSGLFGVLLVLMTFAFVRRIRGQTEAVLSSLILLLNIEFFVYSHSAVTDMALAFFITTALYAFYIGWAENDPRWFAGFWAASALAVLTKGAIGLLFPAAAAFLFLIVSRQLTRLKEVLRPAHLALFFIVAAPWFATQFYVNGWDFFNAFIVKHHIRRYSDVISSHSGPVYFYIGILSLGFFPWAAFLPGALWRSFKERANPQSRLYALCAVWFIFVLVFFSISRTKLPNYIFPLLPAASLLAGGVVADIYNNGTVRGRGGLYGMAGLSFVFGAALFTMPFIELKSPVKIDAYVFFALGAIFILTAFFSAAALYRPKFSLFAVAGLTALLIIVLRMYAVPPVAAALQKDLYVLSSYARGCESNVTLMSYELNKPSIAFNARRIAPKVEKAAQCDITEAKKRGPVLVITETSRVGELKGFGDLKVISTQGKYTLIGNAVCGKGITPPSALTEVVIRL